jgi:hypothetical protein
VLDSIPPEQRKETMAVHLPAMKRVLFTRSLRLLPLPEQVGVIEALAVVVDSMPGLVPITDQQLLGFLSEFLKMSSVVDGEMSDPNLNCFFADKNGFVTSTQSITDPYSLQTTKMLTPHSSNLFLRQECVAKISFGSYVVIPEDLPQGVQLRVSAIRLFRAVIRRHSDDFFDADSSTPIGKLLGI